MKYILLLALILISIAGCDLVYVTGLPWDANKVYYRGDYAKVGSDMYVSLHEGNQRNYPPTSPSWWSK